MDEAEDARQFKAVLYGGLIFLGSLYYSWTELRYLIWSRSVAAKVVDVKTVQVGGRRGTSERQQVEYAFTDAAGKTHQQKLNVPADQPVSKQGEIQIRYLVTDPPVARLADDWNWFAFVMLAGAFVGLGLFLRTMHAAANA